MKVLFIDSNEVLQYALPNGFADAGHQIMISGPIVNAVHLNSLIDSFSPDLAITYGWGPEQTIEKQHMIKAAVREKRIPHVYWSVEDPLYTEKFVVPLLQAVEPDAVFTICSSHVEYYRSLGFPAAHLDWGFTSSIHFPTAPQPGYTTDIAIIANAYQWVFDHYSVDIRLESIRKLLVPLLQKNIRVDIWGQGWDKMSDLLGIKMDPSMLHGPISFFDSNKIYNSAKINIGFQNYTTQVTQRTYEILGSGGFLLTFDTPAVRALFEPGKHLVVSSSPQQTVELVHHYLRAAQERKSIAMQGQLAVAPHAYRHRVEYMLQMLKSFGIL